VDRLEVELMIVREELAEARERAAKAEGALEAMSGRVQDAASQLAKAEARADRLEAALAEARRGWFERLIAAARRKGA
jgi:predicted  nucleic acid-binding Zn-ribbon protein